MFKQPTVIVVGAGASHDLDFPLGDGLRYKLSSTFKLVRAERGYLAAPEPIRDAISAHSAQNNLQNNDYLQAARTLSSHIMYARSIDEFVDHHRDDAVLVFLAKVGICHAILECERSSKLFSFNSTRSHVEVDHAHLDERDVWLKQLWYMMRQDVPRDRPAELFNNLVIINFNYDRTLEAFLTQAMIDMYGMDAIAAARLVEGAPIYHPYGFVDKLSEHPVLGTAFGEGPNANLLRLAANIRTYCESELSQQKADFQDHLANSKRVVFLGFAYRQLNLDLLSNDGGGSVSIYGTSYLVPEENHAGIEGRLNGVFRRSSGIAHVRLRNVKSAELLRLFEEVLIG